MKILVVGGAGFIGSHMMKTLVRNGHQAIAYDNLSTGHRNAVCYGDLVEGELADRGLLRKILQNGAFDAVMHFASNIDVRESVTDPRKYYKNNVGLTLDLIHDMMDAGINYLIFSSTAAVYGVPLAVPIVEESPIQPINPYGRTKAMIESVLADYSTAYGFSSTSLRYFNAAGADMAGELGERHEPETHLIPLVIQTALGQQPAIKIFGCDYETQDGTCIRDYVHVDDICYAHLLALEALLSGAPSGVFNLGNGHGFSVREVIDAVARVSGRTINIVEANRRQGDPAILIADASRAYRELGWSPHVTELDQIVESAWNFFNKKIR